MNASQLVRILRPLVGIGTHIIIYAGQYITGQIISNVTPKIVDSLGLTDSKQFKTNKPCGFVWQ